MMERSFVQPFQGCAFEMHATRGDYPGLCCISLTGNDFSQVVFRICYLSKLMLWAMLYIPFRGMDSRDLPIDYVTFQSCRPGLCCESPAGNGFSHFHFRLCCLSEALA